MKKFSRIFFLVAVIPVLASCNGGGDELANLQKITFKNFSVAIPSDWRKINKEDFANTIPEETIAIFLKKVEGEDFIQNANIGKESLNTDASSLEYAKANMILGKKALADYRAVSAEETDIQGIKTLLHIFRARNVTTDPLRHYVQGYFARDKIGYTLTCVAKNDDAAQQGICEQIVKSFRFL